MLRYLLDTFWNEYFWLPPNITWKDITPGPDKRVNYTDYRHLLLSIPMALLMIFLRHVLEKYLFAPFGVSLGIKNTKTKKAPSNPTLEAIYQRSRKLKDKQLTGLAKELDFTERQVERWWRLRRIQDKPSTLVKFCETCWKFTYFVFSFSLGLYILWDKDFLWDVDYCYIGYPHQDLTDDVWWFYIISLTFYWSLIILQFWDVKRKDFWQMVVHHVATIALMFFSWMCNFYRVGCLIFLVHDCSEILLELAKAMKYANYQRLCDAVFTVFTVLWIITRLWIFPFYIIWSASIRFPKLIAMFPAVYIFNSLLCILQALHCMWTWVILQVAYRAIITGKIEKDIRSSSSEISDSSQESNHSSPSCVNNKKDT